MPSLENELINAKLDQLEADAQRVARLYETQVGSEQEFAEQAASIFQARVVVFSILQNQPFVFGDSNTAASLDVAHDPIALEATHSRVDSSAAPSSAAAAGSPRWRYRSRTRAS